MPRQLRPATFLTEVLGLPPATRFGPFMVVEVDNWADPMRSRPGQINHNDGGRGVYFADPDGHLMEIITRPYDSG